MNQEESWKENLGGIMGEESWRRNHEGGIMEAWERNGIMEEASLRRNLEVSGGIWALWRHLGSQRHFVRKSLSFTVKSGATDHFACMRAP